MCLLPEDYKEMSDVKALALKIYGSDEMQAATTLLHVVVKVTF
jgi:hypothetical protein